jgi:hypothetical protein
VPGVIERAVGAETMPARAMPAETMPARAELQPIVMRRVRRGQHLDQEHAESQDQHREIERQHRSNEDRTTPGRVKPSPSGPGRPSLVPE